MNWPLPQDFNEAVQNPATAFADPELKAGQAVVGPTGLPLPRSGNFADVYQIRAADGRYWAVKCFTRPVTGLELRYQKVDDALDQAGLPFTIGFTFLNEGVMVRGKWLPAVKMEWVDGLLLNQVARDQAGNPKVLDALCQMWARLCKRLRETGVAHADLQHGNVLLVPGTKPGSYGLKLIDYDGMYVPALANTPSGESGHPNYQHPARAAKQVYSPDLDRFPHLVIATALKGLAVMGTSLWERYDTGDNLLFTDEDFRNPAASKLLKDLWETQNPGLQSLVGHLVLSCARPIPQTPWLDQVAPDGIAAPLTVEQAQATAAWLGVAAPAQTHSAPIVVADASDYGVAPAADPFAAFDVPAEPLPVEEAPKRKKAPVAEKKAPIVPIAIAAGVLLLIAGAVIGGIVLFGGKTPDQTAQHNPDDDKGKGKGKANPKLPPGKDPIVPPSISVTGGTVPPLNLDSAGVPALTRRWSQKTLTTPQAAVASLDGKWVLVKSFKSAEVLVFSAATGNPSAGFTEPSGPIVDFTPLSDGNVAAWSWKEPFALVWNPASGKSEGRIPVGEFAGPIGKPIFVASEDGRYVVVGRAGRLLPTDPVAAGAIKVFEAESGREVLKTDVKDPELRFAAGRLLVADPTRFRWFKLSDGSLDVETGTPSPPGGDALATSRDGVRVLSAPAANELRLYDTRTGKTIANLPKGSHAKAGAISADGQYLAYCSFPEAGAADPQATHLNALDLTTGRLAARVEMTKNRSLDVAHLAFTPNAKGVIVTHSGGQAVEVFDMPTGLVAVGPSDPVPGAGLPSAPLLKPRLAIVTEGKVAANGLQQTPIFSRDSQTVLVSGGLAGTIFTYHAKTGAPGPVFSAHASTPGGVSWLYPFGDNRVISGGFANDQTIWDPKTGKAIPGALDFPDLPPLPPGVAGHAGLTRVVSPTGRYTVLARREVNNAAGPLWVRDTTTGKDVVKAEWSEGSIEFTEDESRVFVLDGLGKATWYKLPSGDKDGEWTLDEPRAAQSRVRGMTADGRLMLFHGAPPKERFGHYLVDGKTGRVVQKTPGAAPYLAQASDISPDGRFVVFLIVDREDGARVSADLYEVETWKLAARLKSAKLGGPRVPGIGFSPDGEDVALHYAEAKELLIFALPGKPVAVSPKMKDPVAPVSLPRKPMPDDAALTKAETKLHTELKKEYGLTKGDKSLSTDKKNLAVKLLDLAEGTADPASRYVMLRDAQGLAIAVSEPMLAMQAHENIVKGFEVEGGKLKLALIEKLKDSVGNDAAKLTVMDLALAASDAAAAADDHATAVKYAQTAAAAAKSGTLPAATIAEAEAYLTRAEKAATAFVPVKAALDQLKAAADDRDAALVVGRYRCFTQGRWDEGAKFLIQGGIGGLKTAAELDAAAPRTGIPDAKVADAWWEYAQTAADAETRATEARARYWYVRALPGLGVDARKQAESRLAFKVGDVEYRAGLLVEFTAAVPAILRGKKARIDPVLSFNAAEFKAMDADGLATGLKATWSGVLVPLHAGRFKLIADTTDPVKVSVDGKLAIDTKNRNGKKEGSVLLTDKPAIITVEFGCPNTDKHSLKLLWSHAGIAGEELIPPEVLYHDAKSESALGKAP